MPYFDLRLHLRISQRLAIKDLFWNHRGSHLLPAMAILEETV
jgi:hypothetical protein